MHPNIPGLGHLHVSWKRESRELLDSQVLRKGNEWSPLSGRVTRVESEVVPATVVSMSHFDCFEEADPPVVHGSNVSRTTSVCA